MPCITGSLAAYGTSSNLLEGHNVFPFFGRGNPYISSANANRLFCIPLLSGIIGMLHSKYVPIGDMIAGGLWLELTLVEAVTGVVVVEAVPKYTVFEVDLMLEYIDIAPVAARMVNQASRAGI
jgi:hypothetical protein